MAEKKEQKRVPGYKSENQKYTSLLVMQYIPKNAPNPDDWEHFCAKYLSNYFFRDSSTPTARSTPCFI